jgi:exodeoxyribonuclease VII large subunit
LEAYRQAVAQVLARGYAIVRDATGKVIDSAHGIAAGDALTLIFHDGKLTVTAEDAAKHPRARPKKPPSPGQGSLL